MQPDNSDKKFARRSPEERAAEIEKKIAAHQESIKKLEQKKACILNPKHRLTKAEKMKLILDKAKDSGLSVEEMAERLDVSFE